MELRCGTCRVCCQLTDLELNLTPRDDPTLYLTDRVGGFCGYDVIRKTGDGCCVHLGEYGCTIYHKRPYTCSEFTCERFLDPEWDSRAALHTVAELRRAARQLVGRRKKSIAARFNALLRR